MCIRLCLLQDLTKYLSLVTDEGERADALNDRAMILEKNRDYRRAVGEATVGSFVFRGFDMAFQTSTYPYLLFPRHSMPQSPLITFRGH